MWKYKGGAQGHSQAPGQGQPDGINAIHWTEGAQEDDPGGARSWARGLDGYVSERLREDVGRWAGSWGPRTEKKHLI